MTPRLVLVALRLLAVPPQEQSQDDGGQEDDGGDDEDVVVGQRLRVGDGLGQVGPRTRRPAGLGDLARGVFA